VSDDGVDIFFGFEGLGGRDYWECEGVREELLGK
jgi:hypothetical protein